MEVLDHAEFQSNDVLIGGKKTGKFKVMDDPHLMSMLSTNLYANPLRTMIQEICFNAWDAHRMGNCQDKPIDVYINDTTGLIVRDYGPGIEPEMIDEIYCTYGASTKRQDENQTGGFGLGSKSPYAYSDSFTVANHHGNRKSMFIMRRVHDENDGGPGYDVVIDDIPTEEHGLLVTVPLKSQRDMDQAYEYLKEILFLSGIKINIHYKNEGEEVENIEAESLQPGEFILSDHKQSGMYAVYGGVKYQIPNRDEYSSEYRFLQKISNQLGSIFIGFAPNTLTPMPNREGLNMRDKSIESITAQLEIIQEHFMSQLVPAVKTTLLESMNAISKNPFDAHFLLYRWNRVGEYNSLHEIMSANQYQEVYDAVLDRCPEEFNNSIWVSLVKLTLDKTRTMVELMGYDKFYINKSLIWAKVMPQYKSWRGAIQQKGDVLLEDILKTENAHWCSEMITLRNKLQDLTDQECSIRVKTNDSATGWNILSNVRRAGKFNEDSLSGKQKNLIQALDRKGTLLKPTAPHPDRLWFQKDGKEFQAMMASKKIIVAKTATALNDTQFHYQEMLVPDHPRTYGHDPRHYGRWRESRGIRPVAAIIVHKKKGHYDLVVEFLQNEGWDVYEADEPEVKVKAPPVVAEDGTIVEPEKKGPAPMYVVDYWKNNWEGDEEVKKPSTYLYATQTELNGYDQPYDKEFVSMVMQYAPKMVMIHNKAKLPKLEKAGCVSFYTRVEMIVDKLLEDKERMKIMAKHWYVSQEGNLPKEIMSIPEMQKIMGLPYYRSKQAENFQRDMEFLGKFMTETRSYYRRYEVAGITRELRDKVQKAFAFAENDDSVSLVRKMCKASRAFDENVLRIMAQNMKRGEQKMFAQKIARFLRTV